MLSRSSCHWKTLDSCLVMNRPWMHHNLVTEVGGYNYGSVEAVLVLLPPRSCEHELWSSLSEKKLSTISNVAFRVNFYEVEYPEIWTSVEIPLV